MEDFDHPNVQEMFKSSEDVMEMDPIQRFSHKIRKSSSSSD